MKCAISVKSSNKPETAIKQLLSLFVRQIQWAFHGIRPLNWILFEHHCKAGQGVPADMRNGEDSSYERHFQTDSIVNCQLIMLHNSISYSERMIYLHSFIGLYLWLINSENKFQWGQHTNENLNYVILPVPVQLIMRIGMPPKYHIMSKAMLGV